MMNKEGSTKNANFKTFRAGFFTIKQLVDRHCGNALEKITHFEKKFQSALNLGPNQRTLKKKFEVR